MSNKSKGEATGTAAGVAAGIAGGKQLANEYKHLKTAASLIPSYGGAETMLKAMGKNKANLAMFLSKNPKLAALLAAGGGAGLIGASGMAGNKLGESIGEKFD